MLVSPNIDKNLTQREILLISYKCEHFQQNILKINPFSSSKSHKGVMPGRVAQLVACLATDACLTANPGPEFDPGLVPYFRGD